MDDIKTVAAYIRVSDERQDEYSPDSQLKNIRAYCEKNGYYLPEDYIFYDDGISGRSAKKRDAFRDLIGLAKGKDHPIDAILVWKFSRFARNQEESIVYKAALKRDNVSVISISEPLPDGPFGPLIERVIEWMDEYYSIRLSDEVRRGMLEKATRGEPTCAPPFGYEMRGKQYSPVERDAEIVREVFSMYINGVGMRKIASTLGDRGIRTKYGNPPDNRWIEYMLHNPVYIGKICWCTSGKGMSARDYDNPNIVITDGSHEPIISLSTWEKAQDLLKEDKSRYSKHARKEAAPATYAFRSLFRCSSCGATLIRASTKSSSLQCHNYSRGSCHHSHSITMAKAQAALVDALTFCADRKEFRVSPDAQNQSSPDTSAIDAKIKAEQRRLQRAADAYQAGVDTLEEYAAAKKKIGDTIASLEKEKEALSTPSRRTAKNYISMIRNALSLLDDPTADEGLKNTVLLELLEKVVFHADSRSIDVYFRP